MCVTMAKCGTGGCFSTKSKSVDTFCYHNQARTTAKCPESPFLKNEIKSGETARNEWSQSIKFAFLKHDSLSGAYI